MADGGHIRGILLQMLEAHAVLLDPGGEDLDTVRRELARINGLARVLVSRGDGVQSADFRSVRARLERYLREYDFEQEIGTMSALYSGDAGRVRSMRLKILGALSEHKMIDDARRVAGEL